MKIVIVGGGTAGWITALKFIQWARRQSDTSIKIEVVESSKIGIIGAGEGSTGVFTDFLWDVVFNEFGETHIDFLKETGSTLKLGIRFKDWNGIGTEYLSPIQTSTTSKHNIDFSFLHYLVDGKAHLASDVGYLMEAGLSTLPKKENVNTDNGGHSYHFDAHKVGKYFKKVALKNGASVIDSEVLELNRNSENGSLKSVKLSNGTTLYGDFWIDCSGFNKVLIGPMGGGWESYSQYLPTNKAIPYVYPHEDIPKLETTAWAQNNGWMWQIPTQERLGCGYVFSDYFTTEDTALEELQKTTGRKIEPIRTINFEAGRVQNFWVKNVVAVGLSSGFLEPLQATSIHTTLTQIYLLTEHYFLNDKNTLLSDSISEKYNKNLRRLSDDFRDLIQIHYMTQRNDTDFWKYCNNGLPKTDFTKYILEICKHRSPSILDFDVYFGAGGWGVMGWTLAGLDLITKKNAEEQLSNLHKNLKGDLKRAINHLEKNRKLNDSRLMTQTEFWNGLIDGKLYQTQFNNQIDWRGFV
jgi:tryptophan halogenase